MKSFKGFTNRQCEFFPCHQGVKREFNCLFCYCPLMHLECPGPYKVFTDKYGIIKKDCSECTLPHDGIEQSWKFIQRYVSVAPPWSGKPQGNFRIRKLSKYVTRRYDVADIAWAEENLENERTTPTKNPETIDSIY